NLFLCIWALQSYHKPVAGQGQAYQPPPPPPPPPPPEEPPPLLPLDGLVEAAAIPEDREPTIFPTEKFPLVSDAPWYQRGEVATAVPAAMAAAPAAAANLSAHLDSTFKATA